MLGQLDQRSDRPIWKISSLVLISVTRSGSKCNFESSSDRTRQIPRLWAIHQDDRKVRFTYYGVHQSCNALLLPTWIDGFTDTGRDDFCTRRRLCHLSDNLEAIPKVRSQRGVFHRDHASFDYQLLLSLKNFLRRKDFSSPTTLESHLDLRKEASFRSKDFLQLLERWRTKRCTQSS